MTALRVLLTDDDESHQLLFKEALESVPVSTEFISVMGGEQLLNYLSSHSEQLPDVVFLDLNMPKINGFDCLKRIKQNEKLRDLPIVICTTSGDERSVKTTFEEGAHFYIIKPFNFSDLIKVISEALVLLTEKNFGPLPKDKFVLNKNQ